LVLLVLLKRAKAGICENKPAVAGTVTVPITVPAFINPFNSDFNSDFVA
jgi:hypothetical protein